ncbi:hypothetical protein HA402_001154 [Bradysia odoriphaga]|nr:hypothetical protein HA402_001154 [Bradysia odoriphaga]
MHQNEGRTKFKQYKLIIPAYGSDVNTKMNLIGVDWSGASSSWNYFTAVQRVPIVGKTVAEFIEAAVRNDVMVFGRTVHLVGHSLGAHVAGFIGKYVQEAFQYDIRIPHITALDPAGPTIGHYACKDRLCNTDAQFVEIVHTNGGILGLWDEIRPLDIYLNGGHSQPGCTLPPCSHSFSHEWYRQVMNNRQGSQGWLCKDLAQLEKEKKCNNPGNPREYFFRILQDEAIHGGIAYVPTQKEQYVEKARTARLTTTDDTLVVFGANRNNVEVLVSLLSDDGNLAIKVQNGEIKIINPSNFDWKPDRKYHVCDETSPDGIRRFLSELNGPFRYVVVFDTTDMFMDPFWEMVIYLQQEIVSKTYTTKSGDFSSRLELIALNNPHDQLTLQEHVDDLKKRVQNGLDGADFQMYGMHTIERSGPLRTMTELRRELAVIKNAVDE